MRFKEFVAKTDEGFWQNAGEYAKAAWKPFLGAALFATGNPVAGGAMLGWDAYDYWKDRRAREAEARRTGVRPRPTRRRP